MFERVDRIILCPRRWSYFYILDRKYFRENQVRRQSSHTDKHKSIVLQRQCWIFRYIVDDRCITIDEFDNDDNSSVYGRGELLITIRVIIDISIININHIDRSSYEFVAIVFSSSKIITTIARFKIYHLTWQSSLLHLKYYFH